MSVKHAAIVMVIAFVAIYSAVWYSSNKTKKLEAGPKRYVVYNKNQFKKPEGVQMNIAIASQALELMPEINGAVLASIPKDLPEGWVVEEENNTYHTMQGCAEPLPSPTPIDCPTRPTPCTNCPPEGTPGPTAMPTAPPQGRSELFNEWWVQQVHAGEAQAVVDTSKVTVCIIDTGIDINHPILKGRIAGGASMLGGSYQDDQGHGTHVAGIVTAVSQAMVYAVKALDRNGSGNSNWIANAQVHCADKGFKIISMSLGSEQYDGIIAEATKYAQSKGAIVIAAAGNNGAAVGYPAALANVLAIAAVDRNNRPASFTSRGPQVAFASYGVDIVSARLGGGKVPMSGTSMACPNAAGVLTYAVAAGKTMRAILLNIGRNFEGAGLADALRTVQ